MKKQFLLIVSLFVLIGLIAIPLFANEEWEMVIDEDGITIENREVEGFKMKQLKGKCVLDAPIEVVFEVMDDSSQYHLWFGDCIEQIVVKRMNEYNKFAYHVVNVPWPLGDRDAIAKVSIKADWKKGKIVQRVDSVRQPEDSKFGMDKVTEEKGRVRMPVMDGIFTYSRIAPDKTEFEYIAIADPGIALPGWLLNIFSTKQPHDTLKNIKEEIKKPVYYERASKKHGKKFPLK